MAMTLEDAERVFGVARGKLRAKARALDDMGYELRRRGAELPAWAPIAAAAVAGLVVGAALLWAGESQAYRVRAILQRDAVEG